MKKIIFPVVFGLMLGSGVAMAEIDAIVDRHCQACHDAGLAGAPKMDDADAWAPRIATGVDAMAATVISGKGAMPPKGTCFSCSDEQIKAAVEVMINRLQ